MKVIFLSHPKGSFCGLGPRCKVFSKADLKLEKEVLDGEGLDLVSIEREADTEKVISIQ